MSNCYVSNLCGRMDRRTVGQKSQNDFTKNRELNFFCNLHHVHAFLSSAICKRWHFTASNDLYIFPVCASINLSVCPCVHASIHLSVCLSVRLSICQSICPSVCHLSICSSVYLSAVSGWVELKRCLLLHVVKGNWWRQVWDWSLCSHYDEYEEIVTSFCNWWSTCCFKDIDFPVAGPQAWNLC